MNNYNSPNVDMSTEITTVPTGARYTAKDIRAICRGGAISIIKHPARIQVSMALGSAQQFTLAFAYNTLPDSTQIAELYDLYRIDKVVYDVHLAFNPVMDIEGTVLPPSTGVHCYTFPKLWWCSDNDASASLTLDQIKQRDGARSAIVKPNEMFSIVHYPEVPLASNNASGGYTVRQNRANEWFGTGNTATTWGFLKCAFEAPVINNFNCGVYDNMIQIQPHVYMLCKVGK